MTQKKKWLSAAKFEIALMALKGETTLNEICKRYQVAPSQVHAWRKELLERGAELFGKKDKSKATAPDHARTERVLYEKIGQLTVERDFLKKLEQIPRGQRRLLVNEESKKISLRRQCVLLGINRSTQYYEAKAVTIDDVTLLNEIRDIWIRHSYYGYRRITKELRFHGFEVNRKRVQRLMQLGGVQAIHPGPNTSKRNKLHAVHPYLLRDITINSANKVWMVDITYLRLEQGFVYLVALIDVYSRYIVGWSLSNTLETEFCLDALKSALMIAKPEIINSDQGCQFTSEDWVDFLRENSIQVSMTGKGRCLDNIYIERFWRSFKREEFYLNEYEHVGKLKNAIKAYIEFYNQCRWHQSLDYKTPAEIYFGGEGKGKPVDMWTSASHQPSPFGTCGEVMDNATALPTTSPHSIASRPQYPQAQ